MGPQTNESVPGLPWVVLKFGGTSVASAENWQRIAGRIKGLANQARVWVVASALSQVSNRLEQAIVGALLGKSMDSFVWILDAHEALSTEPGIGSTTSPALTSKGRATSMWLARSARPATSWAGTGYFLRRCQATCSSSKMPKPTDE